MSEKARQKALFRHCLQNSVSPCLTGSDDGVSGTTFDRSGFQTMIADMEAGRLGVIIVKDLSRLGREYIQSGNYMELIFPVYGVRFIAVNNNADSDDPRTIELTPLLNIMNDLDSYRN